MASEINGAGKHFRRSWADMNSDDSSMGVQVPSMTRRKDDPGCNSLQLPKNGKAGPSSFSVVCDDSYAPGPHISTDNENRKNMLNEAFRGVGISNHPQGKPQSSTGSRGGDFSCFGFLLPKSEETFEGDTRSRMVGTSSEESKLGKRLLSAVAGGQSDFSAMIQGQPNEQDNHASKFRRTSEASDNFDTSRRHATSFMSADPIAPSRRTVNDGMEKSKVLNSKRLNLPTASSTGNSMQDTNITGGEDHEWEARFQQRERQIELTKGSKGYQAYIAKTPKEHRSHNDPQTPSGREMCSKRQFDGKLLKWRKMLRQYDASGEADGNMST